MASRLRSTKKFSWLKTAVVPFVKVNVGSTWTLTTTTNSEMVVRVFGVSCAGGVIAVYYRRLLTTLESSNGPSTT